VPVGEGKLNEIEPAPPEKPDLGPLSRALDDWLKTNSFQTFSEWMVRFGEAVALAAAFQFAAAKSKDPYVGLLALLLGLAATYYVIELWARIAKGLPTPAKPAWLKWLVVLALLGFLVWNYWMGAMRLQEAIDALAKSS
jgi:hypothetical protein